MDGVVTDFERAVLEAFRHRHSDLPFIPLDKRTTFNVKEQYPLDHQPLIEAIYLEQGFYAGLQPIDGSLEALTEMAESDEVFLCTSPLRANPFCVQEKFEWIEKQLGKAWTKRVIVTKDKTIVDGNVLVDDREQKGVQEPIWEHVLYDQPYNVHVTGKRRMTWQNWKAVLQSR